MTGRYKPYFSKKQNRTKGKKKAQTCKIQWGKHLRSGSPGCDFQFSWDCCVTSQHLHFCEMGTVTLQSDTINAYVRAQSLLSCPTLCSPVIVAHQAPQSIDFPRQEY